MAEPIVLGIVGIKNMGEYDSQTNYEKLNVVTYEGSTYCALRNTVGNLPTNTDYWQLYAEKGGPGPQGPKPVKGVDYYTEEDKDEISTEIETDVIEEVSNQLSSLASISPKVANSISDMVDTTTIYVLSTDGHWYWYNGSTWIDGGLYQAVELDDNSITSNKFHKIEVISNNHFDKSTTKNGYINSTNGTINENQTSSSGLNRYSGFIKRTNSSTIYINKAHNCVYYDSSKAFISGSSANEGSIHNLPSNCEYVRISFIGTDINTIQVNFQAKEAIKDDFKYIIEGVASEADTKFLKGKLIPENILAYETVSRNIFNKYTCVPGLLSTLDGNIVNALGAYTEPMTSEFIEVDENTIYTRRNNDRTISGPSRLCFYTLTKEFISASDANNDTFTTPQNCKYFRVSYNKSQLDKVCIIKGTDIIDYDDFRYVIKGLQIEDHAENSNSSLTKPIKGDSIDSDTIISRTEEKSYINVENDEYLPIKNIILNKDFDAPETVRQYYYFKNNNKVCEIEFDYKIVGTDTARVNLACFNTSNVEISSNYRTIQTYHLTSKDWKHVKIRFLQFKNNNISRLQFASYVGCSLYLRNLSVNFSNIANNARPSILKFCGHQGLNLLAPKNTLPSFEYAVAGGLKECVINVNWTSDEEIVCLHDNTIDATSDGTGNIHNMTYATALTYDFGSWFDPIYTGTKIPKLDEILNLFAMSGVRPIIRWPDNPSATIREKIFDLLEKNNLKNKATIIGFSLSTLTTLRNLHPEYKYGYCNVNAGQVNQSLCDQMISSLGVGSIIDVNNVPSVEEVKLAHDNNLEIGCWFINEISRLHNAVNNGVDYIKTDIYALQNCNFKD